mgnify:FL=1
MVLSSPAYGPPLHSIIENGHNFTVGTITAKTEKGKSAEWSLYLGGWWTKRWVLTRQHLWNSFQQSLKLFAGEAQQ